MGLVRLKYESIQYDIIIVLYIKHEEFIERETMARRRKDWVGKKYGMLTIISDDSDVTVNRKVLCECECGNVASKVLASVTSGNTKSCGCQARGAFRKLPEGEAAFNWLYSGYRSSAEKRNYTFDLTKEQFKVLTKGNCVYCGTYPTSWTKNPKGMNGSYLYNGVDRVNNDRGYEMGNVVSCCWTCNKLKNTLGGVEFIDHCIKIAKHHSNHIVGGIVSKEDWKYKREKN